MKRTNLVLNEETLEKATRLMGAKTYSDAVNRALEEMIKLIHLRGLLDLMGKDIWSGDLAEMREEKEDSTKRPPSKKNKR